MILRTHVETISLLLSLACAALAAGCSDAATTMTPSSDTKPTEPVESADPTEKQASSTPALRSGVDADVLAPLTEAGLEIATLPNEIMDLTDEVKLEAVMKSFTIALGTTCAGCHKARGTQVDYHAPTPKKAVAARMWTQFVRGLKQADGSALYCDSCHQGKMEFLDRANERALGAWMQANFVAKLARMDGGEHSCGTCHGTPFTGGFLATWTR